MFLYAIYYNNTHSIYTMKVKGDEIEDQLCTSTALWIAIRLYH
jgi:hypothetical protein